VFGFSWAEIFLTSAVALIVIGPKDIPKVLYQIGRFARRLQYVKFAMSQQFEDFLKEHDLEDIRHDVNFEARNRAEIDADEEYHKPVIPPARPEPLRRGEGPSESEGSASDEPRKIPRGRSE
jgi:sec-independent protein translocase protein TatB